jgi:hypothetical protein
MGFEPPAPRLIASTRTFIDKAECMTMLEELAMHAGWSLERTAG